MVLAGGIIANQKVMGLAKQNCCEKTNKRESRRLDVEGHFNEEPSECRRKLELDWKLSVPFCMTDERAKINEEMTNMIAGDGYDAQLQKGRYIYIYIGQPICRVGHPLITYHCREGDERGAKYPHTLRRKDGEPRGERMRVGQNSPRVKQPEQLEQTPGVGYLQSRAELSSLLRGRQLQIQLGEASSIS